MVDRSSSWQISTHPMTSQDTYRSLTWLEGYVNYQFSLKETNRLNLIKKKEKEKDEDEEEE